MTKLIGACHCGNIRFEFTLTRAPQTYSPRACDCDFCTKHAAAWLSDAEGALTVRIGKESHAARYRQGSGQAEFLLCTRCGVLTGVFYRSDGHLYGAVNARAVQGHAGFGPEQPVSPQTLSPGDKTNRWRGVWFAKVSIDSDDA